MSNSLNPKTLDSLMWYELGKKSSKSHFHYIKWVEGVYDIIFNMDLDLQTRIKALYLLGVTDNKIDKDERIAKYMRLIEIEQRAQTYYLEHYYFQNLRESESYVNYYLKEIARLISPTALDVGYQGEDPTAETQTQTRQAMGE